MTKMRQTKKINELKKSDESRANEWNSILDDDGETM